MKWARCPGCQKAVPVMPLAGTDPVIYRITRHNEPYDPTVNPRPTLCPMSITSADGPIYDSREEVPNG